jgi:hypothetical protein
MEATPMKLAGIIGTVLLSLILVAPVYAQEQRDQDEQKDQKEQTAKPAQDEKKAETEKSAKQDEKSAQQEKSARSEEKSGQPENSKQEEKNAQEQHAQSAKNAGGNGGRIPADRYKANFGREHTFRVTQGDFNNHRFQYGGYWFGFAAPWPSNWLYTQDVFVVDIGGVYYLCNPTYPGVNVELNITL